MKYALLNGVRVCATDDSERGLNYLCPYEFCKSREVRINKGEEKQPYFSHISLDPECEALSEHETQSHLAMKDTMQRLLKIPGDQIEYGKIKGVRPDLVYFEDGMKFALEVQHSWIADSKRYDRDTIYKEKGFIPIWIFHRREREGKNKYDQGIYGALKDIKDSEGRLRIKLKEAEWFDENDYGSVLYLSFDQEFKRPLLDYFNVKDDPESMEIKEPRILIKKERIHSKDRFVTILKERAKDNRKNPEN